MNLIILKLYINIFLNSNIFLLFELNIIVFFEIK